ncbi:MAG: hypothetical protein FWE35_10045 [Streptosporangiales bacterium]|nr:hypothetical protein [Streptosporangiales bacterium]
MTVPKLARTRIGEDGRAALAQLLDFLDGTDPGPRPLDRYPSEEISRCRSLERQPVPRIRTGWITATSQ